MSPGQSFGSDYVFVPTGPMRKVGVQQPEPPAEPVRDRFDMWSAMVGVVLVSVLAIVLIAFVWSAPGYNASRYSSNYSRPAEPPQSNFITPANCEEGRSNPRCR
jgi:hypothetical protein